ncbi:MAG: TPM domain-containing protein [Bacteroidales bacterium]|nr:TPM domain-containing protein [Bacteroidales bacterium]
MEIKASKFFTKEQQEQIRDAIRKAENETSGEIRVHIETGFRGSVLDRASWIFRRIGMHATENHNGVLFYLAVKNREFAIIGDGGINSKVPDNFWNEIKEVISRHFRDGRFTEGLVEGIIMTGNQLREHFPFKRDDVNELSDEISFDEPEQPAML